MGWLIRWLVGVTHCMFIRVGVEASRGCYVQPWLSGAVNPNSQEQLCAIQHEMGVWCCVL